MRLSTTLDRPMRYVAIARGRDRYVLRYEKGGEAKLLSTLIEYAGDKDLNLTWLDVLLIMHKLKL